MSTPSDTKTVWRLKNGQDRRFRAGHPWVYSNELQDSPKGIEPGAPVELRDAAGRFLARGYGNPHSLIAFRVLARDPGTEDPHSPLRITEALGRAGLVRAQLGLGEVSHRLCFAEADGIPGLVIDRFALQGGGQIFSVQAHTAGADRISKSILEILESYAGKAWPKTGVILKNDVSVRKLEGLEPEGPQVLRPLAGTDPAAARILVPGATPGTATSFEVDLINGQKTGFFLDQTANVQLAAQRLGHMKPARVLDLCTYVGQWSAQLARVFGDARPEFTLVDSSATALERAKKNVEAAGGSAKTLKGDVLKDLEPLEEKSFDLVICDPPALIKGRKDIPTGTHAYLQLNTQVFRLVKSGGAVVTCSCSSLLEEEEFLKTLSKAAYRNRRKVRWIARGGGAPDHPVLAEFPEGRYLKCWIGVVE